MKGQREVKTRKWYVKTEARELLRGLANAQGSLLDIAAQPGERMEPVGRLAGREIRFHL